jgi:hypothetical protein
MVRAPRRSETGGNWRGSSPDPRPLDNQDDRLQLIRESTVRSAEGISVWSRRAATEAAHDVSERLAPGEKTVQKTAIRARFIGAGGTQANFERLWYHIAKGKIPLMSGRYSLVLGLNLLLSYKPDGAAAIHE